MADATAGGSEPLDRDPTSGTGAGPAVIVLAAGQGTRLRSRLPKPLHRVGGRALIDHVLAAAAALRPVRTIVVTGHGAATLRQHLGLDDAAPASAPAGLVAVTQAEQRGTGHAVAVAVPCLPDAVTTVVILYADTPLVTPETLSALVVARAATGARLAMVTCPAPNPTGYGRIVRDAAGRAAGIAEEKTATPAERAISEINAGIYAVDAGWLRTTLPRLAPSPTGEVYLTDLVGLAVAGAAPDQPWPVVTVNADISEALGVNDRVQLAEAAAFVRARVLRRLMLDGVTIVDPATTYIDAIVRIDADTIIEPGSIITGATTIGTDCQIGPGARIDACTIGNGCRVIDSTLESSTLADGATIGPYSHLRPGSSLGAGVHVGNFAEIKNSRLGPGTAMGHVGYIGDADIGAGVNIGAGAITANYDGRRKHRTTVGDGAFIGVDTVLRAPVTVAAGARTGAGAVVTRDVAAGQTVVGVPARPLTARPPATDQE
ncbi:MAG: bifunctional UDP-N-acetylglucosamine diphosphorylase/glucosamine-1-phosphate N-acetyltransferase GlmU [Chloroflexi bacterium]|nr:bifunctional UDP-N-acetylglucosamine diphosphorylase/glucosamine-1-phosphate N-acetyltransferase GlmU [Chloroflexota bacterium]